MSFTKLVTLLGSDPYLCTGPFLEQVKDAYTQAKGKYTKEEKIGYFAAEIYGAITAPALSQHVPKLHRHYQRALNKVKDTFEAILAANRDNIRDGRPIIFTLKGGLYTSPATGSDPRALSIIRSHLYCSPFPMQTARVKGIYAISIIQKFVKKEEEDTCKGVNQLFQFFESKEENFSFSVDDDDEEVASQSDEDPSYAERASSLRRERIWTMRPAYPRGKGWVSWAKYMVEWKKKESEDERVSVLRRGLRLQSVVNPDLSNTSPTGAEPSFTFSFTDEGDPISGERGFRACFTAIALRKISELYLQHSLPDSIKNDIAAILGANDAIPRDNTWFYLSEVIGGFKGDFKEGLVTLDRLFEDRLEKQRYIVPFLHSVLCSTWFKHRVTKACFLDNRQETIDDIYNPSLLLAALYEIDTEARNEFVEIVEGALIVREDPLIDIEMSVSPDSSPRENVDAPKRVLSKELEALLSKYSFTRVPYQLLLRLERHRSSSPSLLF